MVDLVSTEPRKGFSSENLYFYQKIEWSFHPLLHTHEGRGVETTTSTNGPNVGGEWGGNQGLLSNLPPGPYVFVYNEDGYPGVFTKVPSHQSSPRRHLTSSPVLSFSGGGWVRTVGVEGIN